MKKFCKQCGAQLESYAQFCNKCGAAQPVEPGQPALTSAPGRPHPAGSFAPAKTVDVKTAEVILLLGCAVITLFLMPNFSFLVVLQTSLISLLDMVKTVANTLSEMARYGSYYGYSQFSGAATGLGFLGIFSTLLKLMIFAKALLIGYGFWERTSKKSVSKWVMIAILVLTIIVLFIFLVSWAMLKVSSSAISSMVLSELSSSMGAAFGSSSSLFQLSGTGFVYLVTALVMIVYTIRALFSKRS